MSMTSEPAVVIRGLHKAYGKVEAVAGIDLTIAHGEVFALLGPNGAGKTTTVEILEGYRRRSGGDVRVLGVDPETGGRELRERIGIVTQESGIGLELTVRETLELYSAAYPAPLPGRRRRRARRPRGEPRRPRADAVRRPTPPTRPRARRRRRPRVALPRRADDRLRPLGATTLVGARREPALARQDDPADDPLHGRGPEPRRPRSGHRRAAASSPRAPPRCLRVARTATALVRFRLPEGVGTDAAPAARRRRRSRSTTGSSASTPSFRLAHLTPLLGWASARGEELEALTVTRPVARGRLPRAHRWGANRDTAAPILSLDWLWFKGRLRLMTRTPRATFFTFIFPLILLVLLDSLGSGAVTVPGGEVAYAQYITPAIAIFALTAATYYLRHLRSRNRPRARDLQARARDAARRWRCSSAPGSRPPCVAARRRRSRRCSSWPFPPSASISAPSSCPAAFVTLVLGAAVPSPRSASQSAPSSAEPRRRRSSRT